MEDDQQMQRRVSARGASVFPSMERRKTRKTQPPGLKSRGAAEKRQTDLNCGGTGVYWPSHRCSAGLRSEI